MLRESLDNPFLRFLLFAGLSFLIWSVSYEYVLSKSSASPKTTQLDNALINNIADLSEGGLLLLGHDLRESDSADGQRRIVGIEGSSGVWVGNECNGLVLFALFLIFIFWFPGPLRSKLWFIPFGLAAIHLLNVLRIVALCLIVNWRPEYLEFNHTYTFTILVNGAMFLLWIWWAKSFSGIKTKKS